MNIGTTLHCQICGKELEYYDTIDNDYSADNGTLTETQVWGCRNDTNFTATVEVRYALVDPDIMSIEYETYEKPSEFEFE